MADKVYTGSTGWGTSGDWSPSGVPVTLDRVFARNTTNSITADMDQGGVDLALIDTASGYTGTIGALSNELLIASDMVDIKGSGGFYIKSDANGAGLKIDEVRIRPSNPNATIQIGSNSGDAGDIDKIIALRGSNTTITSDTVFGSSAIVEVGSINSQAGDVSMTLGSSNTLPTLEQWGGRVTATNIITNARVFSAVITKDDNPITNLDLFNNSTCFWNDASVSGDGITIRVMGSNLILKDAVVMTITNVWLYPGSTIEFDSTIHTITNLYDLREKK